MQKIIFISYLFFEILQRYCKLVTFGTLGMPSHAYHKRQYHFVWNSWCFSTNKKSTWFLKFFRRYYILKNREIWSVKNILVEFYQTWGLPRKKSKEISFCIVFRKIKWQHFQKMQNILFLDPFFPNLGKNGINYSPLTSCKK